MTYRNLPFHQKKSLAMAWLCLEDKNPNHEVQHEVADFVVENFIDEVREYDNTIPVDISAEYFFRMRDGIPNLNKPKVDIKTQNLFCVRHRDEVDDEDQHFVMAETPEEAFSKVGDEEIGKGYKETMSKDPEDIFITEIDIPKMQISYYYWNENLEDWDVDTTNIITP